jgi:hypothetical protein
VAWGEVETRAANNSRHVQSRAQAASLAVEQEQSMTAPASLSVKMPQAAPSTPASAPTVAPIPIPMAAIILTPITTLAALSEQ